MTKEILTVENIKKDLRKYYSNKIKKLPLRLLLILCKCVIAINFVSLLSLALFSHNPGGAFKTVLIIVFCAYFLYKVSYAVIKIIIGLRQVENGSFTITSDWVIEKKPKTYRTKLSTPKPYRLVFAKSGEYNIPSGKSYQWSGPFATYDDTLYKQTEINEEFYVISLGTQKNAIAYRKKHFELKEQMQ